MDSIFVEGLRLEIAVGDILKLNNIMKKSYIPQYMEKSKLREIYYRCDYFQHVNLLFNILEQPGENARPLFSLTESSVKEIVEYDKGFSIIKTELFEIGIPRAIVENEVTIKKNARIDNLFFGTEERLISHLASIEESFLLGLINTKERENQKEDAYALYYHKMIQDDKWGFNT